MVECEKETSDAPKSNVFSAIDCAYEEKLLCTKSLSKTPSRDPKPALCTRIILLSMSGALISTSSSGSRTASSYVDVLIINAVVKVLLLESVENNCGDQICTQVRAG